MLITSVHRPWMKKQTYGKKTVEPWYQSKEWRNIRANHLMTSTLTPYGRISNAYCVQCFNESKGINKIPGHTVDHITPIKEGGDKRGPLQTLCKRHNAQKTARDGNRQRTKPK